MSATGLFPLACVEQFGPPGVAGPAPLLVFWVDDAPHGAVPMLELLPAVVFVVTVTGAVLFWTMMSPLGPVGSGEVQPASAIIKMSPADTPSAAYAIQSFMSSLLGLIFEGLHDVHELRDPLVRDDEVGLQRRELAID
jgi:hypothetical protein